MSREFTAPEGQCTGLRSLTPHFSFASALHCKSKDQFTNSNAHSKKAMMHPSDLRKTHSVRKCPVGQPRKGSKHSHEVNPSAEDDIHVAFFGVIPVKRVENFIGARAGVVFGRLCPAVTIL